MATMAGARGREEGGEVELSGEAERGQEVSSQMELEGEDADALILSQLLDSNAACENGGRNLKESHCSPCP